ncbi:MAG: hypothetical protein LBC99_02895 [Spirochaetota bacterium]|nr:hypothetical protein [Spirochaetota bacterium]
MLRIPTMNPETTIFNDALPTEHKRIQSEHNGTVCGNTSGEISSMYA